MKASRLEPYKDIMRDRMYIYTLLARLFRVEVDEELFETLKVGGILADDGTVPDGLQEGIALMRGYLNSPEASTLDLARDYAKVFCGASSTNKTAAYPFESVYTSDKGILMQEARDEVLEWYRRFELGKSAEWHDCEDHLGLELEFLAFLINESLEAIESGEEDGAASLLDEQKEFMRLHLLNWVPRFAKDVLRYSNTDFYRGSALLLSAYLDQDFAALEGLVSEAGSIEVLV